MNTVEPLLDDDDDDDADDEGSDDPLDDPGYARARIVSVHHSGGSTWCVVAYIDEPDGGLLELGEEALRIIDQYEAARRRQSEAQALAERRWIKPAAPPAPAGPPAGKLTARQEEFCRHYITQPVATRAAALAGFSEESAASRGSRLLKSPLVLERIAELRSERKLHYVIERDTLHDKLEAVFFEALDQRNHAAAISALRLQAGLAGLMLRPAQPRPGEASPAKADEGEKRQGGHAKKGKKRQGAKARKGKKRQ